MAKKDFDEYVLKISKQYKEFQEVLKEVSKEAQENITSLDFMDNLKRQIEPLKQNYERVMYIKFLLDQPNKKSKLKKYNQSLKSSLKRLNKDNSLNNVLEENKFIISGLKGE